MSSAQQLDDLLLPEKWQATLFLAAQLLHENDVPEHEAVNILTRLIAVLEEYETPEAPSLTP
jgi:hypothetical protein